MPKKISQEAVDLMKADKEKGFENFSASDFYYWVAELPEFNSNDDDNWFDAIEAVNKRRDKKPLLDLLLSDRELSALMRYFLADLLNHGNFQRKALPAYVMSEKAWAEQQMVARVRRLRRAKNLSVKQAIEKVSKDCGIDEQGLADDYQRQRNWVKDFEKRVSKRKLGRKSP